MQKWRVVLAIGLTGGLTGLGLFSPQTADAQALPGGFVYLRDVEPGIIQDMRYATSNNFVGKPLRCYDAAECVVKREVGLAL